MSKNKKIYSLVICYNKDNDEIEWVEERIDREQQLPDNIYETEYIAELDEYLDCFQLLKSRNKLHQQDVIWKNICQYTKWQFIPSL